MVAFYVPKKTGGLQKASKSDKITVRYIEKICLRKSSHFIRHKI